MKRVLITPVLAAVLFAAACGGDLTGGGTKASVRFFHATTGLAGSGGFTMNGQFATGSTLAFGQYAQTCSTVNEGSTSIGFGAANTGGTGLSGNALATLNNQSITAGGNYSVVATGAATSPQLYLLDNSFSGSLGPDQAAVRFVNLAPGPNPVPYVFYVFTGVFTSLPPASALVAASLLVGSPSEFKVMTSGAHTFSTIVGHELQTMSAATLNLQAGTVNTLAIVPNATLDGFQLINIPRC